MKFMKYTIIIERGKNSFGAYAPDIPGLMVVSKSKNVTMQLVKEAIQQHLETLEIDGRPIPEARSESEDIEVEI